MENLNNIALDSSKTDELALLLNTLLSDYSVFYQNVRGFHWNIKGDKFFELHVKFEELYNNLFLKIDEVAERILTLGQIPKYRYTDYLKDSVIAETKEVTNGYRSVEQILESFKIVLAKQRQILETSANLHDEGTNALMSDYIREQEKLVWMYSSFLNKNQQQF